MSTGKVDRGEARNSPDQVKAENKNMAVDSNRQTEGLHLSFFPFFVCCFLDGGKYGYARPQLSPPPPPPTRFLVKQ